VHTALFIGLVVLLFTAVSSVLTRPAVIAYFLVAFGGSVCLLLFWLSVRLVLGPEWWSFGQFGTLTTTPVGSFNDLGLLAGLLIVLLLVALVQLPLRRVVLGCLGLPLLLCLWILAVVNFFLVWVVVGFTALLALLYALARDRLFLPLAVSTTSTSKTTSRPSRLLIGLLAAVTIIAGVFVVGGSYVGPQLGAALAVPYLEVRPSFTTTLTILMAVYRDDQLLFGVGPNRFEDAWRQYKNPVINETMFWNTNFNAGSSYVLTWFITTGLIGGLLLVAGISIFLLYGYRTLMAAEETDPIWYCIATIGFAGAAYVLVMAMLYVPGPAILLLGAFFAGILVVAHGAVLPQSVATVVCVKARARAFLLITGVVVVIIGGIALLYATGRHLSAHALYSKTLTRESYAPDAFSVLDADLDRAYALYQSDRFLADRVSLRLAAMRELLGNTAPSPADRQRFDATAIEVLQLSRQAVTDDPTEPRNHLLLGSVYGLLALAGADTTEELAAASFAQASALDPQNPEYPLVEGQFEAERGNLERAHALVTTALERKSNYVDALYVRSQLERAVGNTAAALSDARTIVLLEPQNSARHFQVGVLELGLPDLVAARKSLETAIQLDPNFANARYLLALIAIEEGRLDEARTLLEPVATTNPDNQELAALLVALTSGATLPPLNTGLTAPVDEPVVTTDEDGVTTVDEEPQTDLLVPVNVPAKSEESTPNDEGTEDDAVTGGS
jgi:tetratricopeptide (TPR) repeat protein